MMGRVRLLAGAAVLLVVHAGGAADDAEARSRALAKASADAWDSTLRVLLARRAVAAAPTVEATSALYDALGEQCETAVLRHGGPVNAAAFSADGAHVATASDDGTARVWSLAGVEEGSRKFEKPALRAWILGGPERVLVATRGAAADVVDLTLWSRDGEGAATPLAQGVAMRDVHVSPTGDGLVALAADGAATVWDRDGTAVKSTPGAAEASYSPKGGAALVRTSEGKAFVVTSKGAAKELAFGKPVTHAAFAPSGAAVVWGDDARVAAFAADGKKLFEVKHFAAVEGVCGNSAGDRLLVAGGISYGVYDGAGALKSTWQKTAAKFTCAAFSADGRYVFTVDGGKHASTWNVDENLFKATDFATDVREVLPDKDGVHLVVRFVDGQEFAYDFAWKGFSTDSSKGPHATRHAWSPLGDWLAIGQLNGAATLLHMKGPAPRYLDAHRGAVLDIVFSPTGEHVATASKDGTARIWSLEPEGTEQILPFGSACWGASMSWKQDRVMAVGWNTLRVVDGRGRPIFRSQHPDRIVCWACTDDFVAVVEDAAKSATLLNLDGKVVGELPLGGVATGVAAAWRGKLVGVFGTANVVKLFDTKAKPVGTIDAGDRIVGASIDSEGKRIFVTTWSNKARIYGASGLSKPLVEWQLPGRTDWGNFAEKGDLLVTLAKDDTVARLWTTKGKLVAELRGATAAVTNYSLAWAGDAALTTSKDKNARIYDAAGRLTATLAHPDEVLSAQFFPDDQRIVTTCKDGAARLWTRAGALVAEIRAHKGSCFTAGYDAAGKRLVTAGEDYCARFWPASVEELEALAAKRSVRDFSDDEKRQYSELLR
jgi:WD40 repeat protein